MNEVKLLTEWADSIVGKYNSKTITEGGNIFKAPGFSKENPQMLTDRISRDEVPYTTKYLEKLTGLRLQNNLLGSTGIAATSGDMDIAIDANSMSKDELTGRLIEQGVKPDDIKRSGDSVHYASPIFDSNGKTDRLVQVDFMFVPDVPFALWSMRTAPDSNYKGVYLQKLRNDLVKTADPNWKWHHFQGVLQRSDNANVFGSDPDKIAQGLIGPKATKADLESVERILAAIKLHRQDIEPQVRDTYRSTLAPKKPGEKPDPNAPQIDEATKPKVGREFQHLEDLVYMHGVSGVKDIVRRLQQIAKSTQELEVKWDGSPAIVFGRDEQGNFHFGDKFSKQATTSGQDVYQQYVGRGPEPTPDRIQFAKSMSNLYNVYERSTPKDFVGYLEAGLMYSTTPPLNENGEYSFMPNTVRYNINKDSELGKRIGKSISGAAATAYYDGIPSQGGQRQPVGDHYKQFTNPSVVIFPPKFVDSPVQINDSRLQQLLRIVTNSNNAQSLESFIAAEPGFSSMKNVLYSYVNSQVDNPGGLQSLGDNFGQWVQSNGSITDSQKQKILNRLETNSLGAQLVFKLVRAVMILKDDVINQLEEPTLGSIGIRASLKTGEKGGEGFVHDDPSAGPTKFVRRNEFTRANRQRD